MTAYQRGYNTLNEYQKKILGECIEKGSGGLSLPMGSGKTLLSLVLGCKFMERNDGRPILVVAAKSLIASWMHEIAKFFGDDLKYEVVHSSMMKGKLGLWKPKEDTMLVLTSPEVLAKAYNEGRIRESFIRIRFINHFTTVNHYQRSTKPILSHKIGLGLFYSTTWSCLIVDEAQKYTNIETQRCQALGSLYANHRWALSGTMFDEPIPRRILGYHVIIDAAGMPRELPATKRLLWGRNTNYGGLNTTLVLRKRNEAFVPPKVNEHVIAHQLVPEEQLIYTMMRNILVKVRDRARQAKLAQDHEQQRLFSSYKLVMVMYLRQALICPLIPLASIAIDASDQDTKTQLSAIITEEVNQLGINQWLDDVTSIRSSRMNATLNVVDQHRNEQVVVFSCFKSYLDIFEYLCSNSKRPILRMKSSMSMKKRGELIDKFRETTNGVLLLTYQLGAEGLNLQCAATVLLVDFWWNASKTQQAIARIFRFGQIAEEINVYFFTANTGIEEILFKKQKAKLDILEELKTGSARTKVPKLKIDQVIRLIEMADNQRLLNRIRYY